MKILSTKHIHRSIKRSALGSLMLACFVISPMAQAVSPAPDGGYPGGNTAEGQNALFSLTTGGFNTAVGFLSLRSNTSGNFNTALGAGALLTNTADSNTAIGAGALFSNTTGTSNIAIGVDAGLFVTTGNNNIHIGNIGVNGITDTDTIRIGTFQTQTFIAGIHGTTTGVTNAIPVVIDDTGQLGTVNSSARFKKDIKPMDTTSEAILALKPVTFHYKSDKTNTAQFGLIAEEVAGVNPDLVVRDGKGKIYTVRYDAVNAMLLNEFLKEHKQVQELEATVVQQQKGIDALVAHIKEQDSKIQKVSDQVEISKAAAQVATIK